MDFQVTWGFPKLAKIALGVGIILIVLVAVGLMAILR